MAKVCQFSRRKVDKIVLHWEQIRSIVLIYYSHGPLKWYPSSAEEFCFASRRGDITIEEAEGAPTNTLYYLFIP